MKKSTIALNESDVPGEERHLKKNLTNRHIQLIAIGGAIGTGLFMGAGKTISLSGVSIIFTYTIIGFFLFFVMRALGELLLSDPKFNSFADFAGEYLGPWASFFIGWSYWLSWVVACVGDIVIIGDYMRFWYPDLPLWIPAMGALLLLVSLNVLSVKMFGEMEFWFALIKVVAIVALIMAGFWMAFSGYTSPEGVKASFHNLTEPGTLFPHGLPGFLAGFQLAFFSFVGIELVGVAAAETKNPEKNLPKAINSIPVRILLFYVLSLACIIAVSSWGNVAADKSPFVQLFTLAGLPAAAAVINFVVLTSALSSANSGVFSTSRMLFGLARQDAAPRILRKLSSSSIPLRGLLLSAGCIFCGILLLFIIPEVMTVFTILSTMCAIMLIFIWSMIMLSWISYRKKRPDLHSQSVYPMPMGNIMSRACLAFFFCMLIILSLRPDTRTALMIAPLWFIWLTVAYKNRQAIKMVFSGSRP